MTTSRTKIIGATVRKDYETGIAAIALATTAIVISRIKSLTLHLDAAPTTSENLTITVDKLAGAAYDINLYTLDLSLDSVVDLVWYPDGDLFIVPGDIVKVDYANSDGNTFGAELTIIEEL